MKIKKIPIICITLMLILFLYACGGADGSEKQNSPDATMTDSVDDSEQQNSPETAAAGNTDGSADEAADEDSSKDGDELDISPQDDEPAEGLPVESGGDEETATADSIVALAESLIGAEYEWGAVGPDTFDNSGFVYYCFNENGIILPRKTIEIFAAGTAVEQEDLLPGDLVFFTYNDDRSASYVGIYIGDGHFISENNEDSPVCIHDMTLDYYTKIFVGAKRYF